MGTEVYEELDTLDRWQGSSFRGTYRDQMATNSNGPLFILN